MTRILATGSVGLSSTMRVVNLTSANSPYNANINELLIVDTTGGNVTINLPQANTNSGKAITIKKTTTANTVLITPAGSETIDQYTNSVPLKLYDQYNFAEVRSDGTGWRLLTFG